MAVKLSAPLTGGTLLPRNIFFKCFRYSFLLEGEYSLVYTREYCLLMCIIGCNNGHFVHECECSLISNYIALNVLIATLHWLNTFSLELWPYVASSCHDISVERCRNQDYLSLLFTRNPYVYSPWRRGNEV
jgi:hypothetical protein